MESPGSAPPDLPPPPATWPPRSAGASRDARLEVRSLAIIDRAGALLGWDPWAGGRELDGQAVFGELLDVMRQVLAGRVRAPAPDLPREELVELCDLLVDLEDLRRDVRDHEVSERLRALTNVQAGLSRLRGVSSVAAILDRAPVEVCRTGGFDRAMLFRVRDSQMIVEAVHIEDDPDGAAELLQFSRNHPADLTHLLLETEMIRRRVPMVVSDPQNDPRVHRPIVEACDTRSYVAAPIMPEGRVIGFLHADRYLQRRHVDEFDREVLWAFAEAFGYAYERTLLNERLRAQRDQVRGMVASTEQLMDELCDAEIAVAGVEGDDSETTGRAAAMLASSPSRLDQLLTRREVEVIKLMAAGETNSGIASRLVISEGTVKSHVKHILRKLRAANRAEAVSRYLRISALGGRSSGG